MKTPAATMRFASAISDAESTGDALAAALDTVKSSGVQADVVFAFFTPQCNEKTIIGSAAFLGQFLQPAKR